MLNLIILIMDYKGKNSPPDDYNDLVAHNSKEIVRLINLAVKFLFCVVVVSLLGIFCIYEQSGIQKFVAWLADKIDQLPMFVWLLLVLIGVYITLLILCWIFIYMEAQKGHRKKRQ